MEGVQSSAAISKKTYTKIKSTYTSKAQNQKIGFFPVRTI